jgi:hypothetical protein
VFSYVGRETQALASRRLLPGQGSRPWGRSLDRADALTRWGVSWAREEETGTCAVAPYEIGQIDFGHIVDHFFWDTDFLAAEHLLDLTTQHRQQVGMSDEAWSLAAGLKPHPDELAIQVWEDEAGWDTEPDEYPSSGTISVYPRE